MMTLAETEPSKLPISWADDIHGDLGDKGNMSNNPLFYASRASLFESLQGAMIRSGTYL